MNDYKINDEINYLKMINNKLIDEINILKNNN